MSRRDFNEMAREAAEAGMFARVGGVHAKHFNSGQGLTERADCLCTVCLKLTQSQEEWCPRRNQDKGSCFMDKKNSGVIKSSTQS